MGHTSIDQVYSVSHWILTSEKDLNSIVHLIISEKVKNKKDLNIISLAEKKFCHFSPFFLVKEKGN